MKRLLLLICRLFLSAVTLAQPGKMNPAIQNSIKIQYFKPREADLFCGDPMPFFHNGTFHVFWLLDKDHHGFFKNPGFHQWAHVTSTDLVHWKHQPMAIEIDNENELSICTGSVFHHAGTFYAFYATRAPYPEINGNREYLSLATSADGVRFRKQPPLSFAYPPKGYDARHFRDPFVFFNPKDKLFYMLVSTAQEKFDYPQQEGKIVFFQSPDMKSWAFKGDFLTPAYARVPECADWFEWNGWYYLLFSVNGGTRYRMSRNPTGPWQVPAVDNLSNDWVFACKSAAFKQNRRIMVGFVPWREGERDNGRWLWGGNLIFRELQQAADGSLKVTFPEEMMPTTGEPVPLKLEKTAGVSGSLASFTLKGDDSYIAIPLKNIPADARLTCTLLPKGWNMTYGLQLRKSTAGFYDLSFKPAQNQVDLAGASVLGVPGLDKPIQLDIVMKGDIVDICVDGRRCVTNRCPEQRGDELLVYVHNGSLEVKGLEIKPLK
jgi:hypothetical protein